MKEEKVLAQLNVFSKEENFLNSLHFLKSRTRIYFLLFCGAQYSNDFVDDNMEAQINQVRFCSGQL